MAYFYYIRPDEMATYRCPVTGPADDGYLADWLCDGRSGRPVLAPNGSPSWSVALVGPNPLVNMVALINTNIDADLPITIGGNVNALLSTVARPDGKKSQPWALVDLTLATELTVGIAGNSVPVIIGEFIGGLARELERPIGRGGVRTDEYRAIKSPVWSSVPGYPSGQERRRFKGNTVLTQDGMDELEAWKQSTYESTRPSLIVPTPSINDCMLVDFEGFEYTKQGPWEFRVTLNFVEYPRVRWAL
jgi:hypothetical protein